MNNERYVPGSEWITYKLYTGTQMAESLLQNKIYPVIKKLLAEDRISQFFFLRYNDTGFHLRVRVKVTDPTHLGAVLEAFVPTLVKCSRNEMMSNVVVDTYVPEYERYGPATMELAEQFFFIDSQSVVDILKLLRKASDNDRQRWLVSTMMVRDTLDCFFDDEQRKVDAITRLATVYKREHRFTTNRFTKQLNDKYRNFNELISQTLSGDNPEMEPYKKVLARRKRAMKRAMADNAALINANKKKWDDNFSSIIHMSMNRLFKTNNRLFEMVIYEFMSKYQTSQLARMKYKAAAAQPQKSLKGGATPSRAGDNINP